MTERLDKGLAFMLQYENVAWYNKNRVRILDRRIYPNKIAYVDCYSYKEVAQAISQMVTQSYGPYIAAGMGMALAAKELMGKREQLFIEGLQKAAHTLSTARPTTTVKMREITNTCTRVGIVALSQNKNPSQAIFEHTLKGIEDYYQFAYDISNSFLEVAPKRGCILTQCFAETHIAFIFKQIRDKSLDLKVICAETRPYLQGARLTASVAYEQGMDVTVITDNMPAHLMQTGKIDAFVAAADVICMDGHVYNKVGTLQYAIAANYFGLPTYITGRPNKEVNCHKTVTIEQRDGNFVLYTQGVRSTMEGVKGTYPSFDRTPPALIRSILTDKGCYSPYELASYYDK